MRHPDFLGLRDRPAEHAGVTGDVRGHRRLVELHAEQLGEIGADGQPGRLAQSVGYGLEAYAMERIPKILSKHLGFVEESSGPEQFSAANGSQDDIDVVVRGTLGGRTVVFLCETKTNISPQEVRGFVATADRVRPQVGCDDVRIFSFAYRADPEARAAVKDVGGYLAFPHAILVQPAD